MESLTVSRVAARLADGASEALAEHVDAGFQLGDAEIDAGGVEFGPLAVQHAAHALLLALLRDVERMVHGLLLLLCRGQALLGVIEFDVDQGCIEDDLVGVVLVIDAGGDDVAAVGLDGVAEARLSRVCWWVTLNSEGADPAMATGGPMV